jgi:hypothetical protein
VELADRCHGANTIMMVDALADDWEALKKRMTSFRTQSLPRPLQGPFITLVWSRIKFATLITARSRQ